MAVHKSKILGIEFEETPEGLMMAALLAEQRGLHSDARDFRDAAIEMRKSELVKNASLLLIAAIVGGIMLWKYLA